MTDDMPDSPPPPHSGLKPGFHTPVRTSTIGMYLFLAALFMLFTAGIFGYVMVRLSTVQKNPSFMVDVPKALWISTMIVIAGSVTIQVAVNELRRERLNQFRRWLFLTILLAIAFVIVQTPSLAILFAEHRKFRNLHLALYGLIFVLIILHALHVLGGIVALAWTSHHARQGKYDHENYHPAARVALYWHFLDGVWLVMFFTFLLMK